MKRAMALKLLAREVGTDTVVAVAVDAMIPKLEDASMIADFLGIDPEVVVLLVDGIAALPADAPPAAEPKRSTKRVKAEQKTLLPADWKLTRPLMEYALAQGLSFDEGVAEARSFFNYWRGKGERMLDWSLTWQNWIRRAAKTKGRKPTERAVAEDRQLVDTTQRPVQGGRTDDDWRASLAEFERSRTWPPALGPQPGEPGCRVPRHLTEQAA